MYLRAFFPNPWTLTRYAFDAHINTFAFLSTSLHSNACTTCHFQATNTVTAVCNWLSILVLLSIALLLLMSPLLIFNQIIMKNYLTMPSLCRLLWLPRGQGSWSDRKAFWSHHHFLGNCLIAHQQTLKNLVCIDQHKKTVCIIYKLNMKEKIWSSNIQCEKWKEIICFNYVATTIVTCCKPCW